VKGLSISAVIKDIFKKITPGKNKKVETSLIEEYIYPKFGPGQLWETAADEIRAMGGEIIQESEVQKINVQDGKIVSVVSGDKVYEADIVLSSMPVNDLIASIDGSAIPQQVQEAAADLPFRDFVTVGLLLNKLNLKNETKIKTLNNIVPDCWIYVQDTGVKLGRIQVFNNWSPYMVEKPEENVWIGLEYFCREGDDFWNLSDEECIELAINELVSMGVISREDVLDSHRERIQKAYPAYFDGYAHMDEIIEYLNTIPNLYCIGRNGQHRYNNMDHSMVTSFEAVKNIVNNVADKSNVWNVNTDEEYHEEKK
jgi:protoporphyrinogen oxidase